MKITYLGHSCFSIENNKVNIIIDPFYDEDRFSPKPTYVVITHAHDDHFGHAEKLCNKGVKFISSFEVCNYAESKGIKNVHHMHIGGYVDFEGFKLKFVPAFHSSSVGGINNVGVATGVIINIDGKILYHSGDTGLFGDMELIGKRHQLDIAFLPIGGNFTMDVDDALYAVGLLKPKMVVPMHYNTFPPIEQNPEEFIEGVSSDIEGKIFEIGETIDF